MVSGCLRLAMLAVVLTSASQAAEFRSIAGPAAVLYDAPSAQATKRFVMGAGYPVEVVVKLDKWIKVRDDAGDISWAEAKSLSDKRTLIVTEAGADVRDKQAPDAPVVFRADKGLLLDLAEAPVNTSWVKVRHRDGQTGYVSAKQVWGL
jgi:SH3-like domain-containing protein